MIINAAAGAPNRPLVLGIDDEAGDLCLLDAALRESGYDLEFCSATDGAEAIARLLADDAAAAQAAAPRVAHPALILLDLKMPGHDGHECLARLKSERSLRDIPVVVVTNSELESDRYETRNLGAVDYVVKTANFDTFVGEIRRVVGRWLPRPPKSPQKPAMNLARILLVEDDPGDAGLVRAALASGRRPRYALRECATLAEARAAIDEGADAVLLDLQLPDSEGLDTVLRLRAIAGSTPIIVITGRSDPEFALDAMRAGADDYVCKAEFASDALIRVIDFNLGRAARNATREARCRQLEERLAASTDELQSSRAATMDALRARQAFLSTIGHETRTPLHGILGMADVMRMSGRLPADQQDRLDKIIQAGRQLGGTIDRVLEVAALEGRAVSLQEAPFSPAALLAEIDESAWPLALARGLIFSLEVDELPDALVGDTRRIGQVLRELVDNAIRFTEQGQIVLAASATASGDGIQLRFEVRDTGIGIPAERIPQLFEPFVQGDASLTRRHSGSGLGLAIARGLISLMHGEFGVDSDPERGSRFWWTCRLQPAAGHSGDLQTPARPGCDPPGSFS